MDDRRPTIADVAQQAGVSKGLVSFAFNDRPGVAPDTRDRIMAVAREMGWRPRPNARSLSTRRSSALGLVVRRAPEVLSSDPFFPAFIAGVETVLTEVNQVLVLSLVPDEAAELRTYRTLVADARVDGVFLTDLRCTDRRLELLAELGLPAVTLGHPDIDSALPAVSLDDAPGVAASVEHLMGLGHRRIGYIAGDSTMVHARRRREAFVAAMKQAGQMPDRIEQTDFSPHQGGRATETLLDSAQPPTAIVYASDPMAIAGIGVAHQRGLRVPIDLSVIGFDGTDLGRHIFPTLTTVVADPLTWGHQAAAVLLQLVATGTVSDFELPPAQLVIRESTRSPAIVTA